MANTATIALALAATAPGPVQVMVLGTYHFDNPGLDLNNVKADDVLTPKRQDELEALAAALAAFRPTRIMVERVASSPTLEDSHYAQFTPAELGKNRDERVQIAYRLGYRLGMKTVRGIDEQPGDGEPDYFPFGKVQAWAEANGRGAELDTWMSEERAAVARIEKLQAEGSISHVLTDLNRPERAYGEQFVMARRGSSRWHETR
jgi:hypothetical protein